MRVIRTPRQAPNGNAHAERFVLSIKSECLNRMMFFGEASLRRAVEKLDAPPPRQTSVTFKRAPRAKTKALLKFVWVTNGLRSAVNA